MDEGAEYFADHAEMIAMAGVLLRQIGEVGGGGAEALGEHAADRQRDLGV
jgi:hypothetical protein